MSPPGFGAMLFFVCMVLTLSEEKFCQVWSGLTFSLSRHVSSSPIPIKISSLSLCPILCPQHKLASHSCSFNNCTFFHTCSNSFSILLCIPVLSLKISSTPFHFFLIYILLSFVFLSVFDHFLGNICCRASLCMKKGPWEPRAQMANKVQMDEIVITLPFDISFFLHISISYFKNYSRILSLYRRFRSSFNFPPDMELMWLLSLCQCILSASVIVVSVRLCMAVRAGSAAAGGGEGPLEPGSVSSCLRLCLGWVGAIGGVMGVPVFVLLNLQSAQCLYTCITLVCCPLLIRQFTMFLLMLLTLDAHLQHHLAER